MTLQSYLVRLSQEHYLITYPKTVPERERELFLPEYLHLKGDVILNKFKVYLILSNVILPEILLQSMLVYALFNVCLLFS